MAENISTVRTGQVPLRQPLDKGKEKASDKSTVISGRADTKLKGRTIEVPKQGKFQKFMASVKAFFSRSKGVEKVKVGNADLKNRDVKVAKESKFKAFFKAIANFFRGGPKLTEAQKKRQSIVMNKMSKNPPKFLKDAITSDGPVKIKGKMPDNLTKIVTDDFNRIFKMTDKESGGLTKDKGLSVSDVFMRDIRRANPNQDRYTITNSQSGEKISFGKIAKDGQKKDGFILTDKNGNKTSKTEDPRGGYLKMLNGDKTLAKNLSFYMTQTMTKSFIDCASRLPELSDKDGNPIAIGNLPQQQNVTIDGDRIILKTTIEGPVNMLMKNDNNDNFLCKLNEDKSSIGVSWTISMKISDLKEGNGKFEVVEPLSYDVNVDVDWKTTDRMNRPKA